MSEPLLAIRELSRAFQGTPVLRGCSCDIYSGEVILLLGANGAGKSTLLKILAGLQRPGGGSVTQGAALRASGLAYHAHQLMLYGELTVAENLRLFAEVAGTLGSQEESIKLWGLSSYRDVPVNRLSKGLGARVSLARVFAGKRALYLLDEPSSALDDKTTEELCRLISQKSSEGAGVVIATHDLARLSSVATRALVLSEGLVRCDSGSASLGASSGKAEGVQRAIDEYRGVNR